MSRSCSPTRSGLNPFFIRAFVQTKRRGFDMLETIVLIPSLSGHSFKPNPFDYTGERSTVLIPSLSGHSFKHYRRRFYGNSGHSLNPFFIRAFVQTLDTDEKLGMAFRLNPFFIRAFVQTQSWKSSPPSVKVLIPSLSGHSFKQWFDK